MREFRFGFNASGLRSARDLAELCRQGEGYGYDVVLGTDHLPNGSPFLPLVVAAQATERMRVGTLTTNNEFWNPALLAREAITVDHLTEGRLELGLGAGHMKWEFDAAGIPWRPLGERVDRLTHAVDELRRIFADGFDEPESAVATRKAFGRAESRPVQRHGFDGSGPPLLIGGTGDRVLRLAASTADIIGLGGVYQVKGEPPGTFRMATAAEAKERVDYVRTCAGDRAAHLEFNALVQFVAITDDRRALAENLVAERAPYFTVDDALETPFALIGTVEQIAEQMRENRERLGLTYITVHEPYMRTFAPVIEKLRS
ncbi:LLM class F420-dependent oxidoreductase [Phytoactinopolyspora halotolerans]|uniref:LLM class F420-dependent oxidoreductase n=1 Tax=Phytoactinopolyspora halotolerans TaxID=1981512 RepID=A0A6L9SG09_9ACTN|nr:LLM class F420-dependent oxidoreductase [Phytoactinopolyspora halotolerans]NEE03010.1 LLM class F420-dependent oxidoreductase [Phytoactinopolyspora halotolerans]